MRVAIVFTKDAFQDALISFFFIIKTAFNYQNGELPLRGQLYVLFIHFIIKIHSLSSNVDPSGPTKNQFLAILDVDAITSFSDFLVDDRFSFVSACIRLRVARP